MMVRHNPEMAVQVFGVSSLVTQLLDTGIRFRRAKHFVVARFGDSLDQGVLTELLRGLDTVPWGHTADAEHAIEAQLLLGGPVCRFELEKGIDWTTLGCYSIAG